VLPELKATLEDLEGRRELAAAKKRTRGKAGSPLRDAAKEIGLIQPALTVRAEGTPD
jgi:hypothetical protein